MATLNSLDGIISSAGNKLPQGSIIYYDSKGQNKAISTSGKIVTIDASSIYSLSNIKLVEVGNV